MPGCRPRRSFCLPVAALVVVVAAAAAVAAAATVVSDIAYSATSPSAYFDRLRNRRQRTRSSLSPSGAASV